jgi:RNA polymerase sigma factor (sigma-70 family)
MKDILDIDLIERIKNEKCDESLKELASRYKPLCLSLVANFEWAFSRNLVDSEFLTENLELLVFSAAISFKKEKKVVFSTWLYHSIKFYFLRNIYREKKGAQITDEILKNFEKENQREIERVKNIKDLAEEKMLILKKLENKDIYQIFRLKYSEPKKTQKEIASTLNIGVSKVSRLHSRGIAFLRKNK